MSSELEIKGLQNVYRLGYNGSAYRFGYLR